MGLTGSSRAGLLGILGVVATASLIVLGSVTAVAALDRSTVASGRVIPEAGGEASAAASPRVSPELDLLDGNQFVATNLSYWGYYDTTNTSFPSLLTGAATGLFWNSADPVLLMAPRVAYTYGHASGLAMFPGGTGGEWTVTAIGTTYPSYTADGISAYFGIDPVNTSSWSPYYWGSNPGSGQELRLSCSGSLVFPYSRTPYLVVQWDPAWVVGNCGVGSQGEWNLYLVDPAGSSGSVDSQAIIAEGPFGSTSDVTGRPGDQFDLSVTYSVATDEVNGSLVDENDTADSSQLSVSLTSQNALLSGMDTNGYVGLGEGGSNRTGWALLYGSVASSRATPIASSSMPSGVDWTAVLETAGIAGAGAVVALVGVTLIRRRKRRS